MENKLARDIKYLKIYSGLLTLAFISFFIMSYTSGPGKKSFEELEVQRLNIVDSKGDLSMVISNSEKQHPGMINGKVLKERKRPAGIIFFNEEQDEVGGLIYGVKGLVFSVDQYKNDQIMQLQYQESKKGERKYGLQLWDRDENFMLPKLVHVMDSLQKLDYNRKEILNKIQKINGGDPIGARRLFVGKNREQQVGLFIQDKDGNDRIKIYVNKQNNTVMELLDKEGNAIPFDSLK